MTLHTLSQVTVYPNYRVSIYLLSGNEFECHLKFWLLRLLKFELSVHFFQVNHSNYALNTAPDLDFGCPLFGSSLYLNILADGLQTRGPFHKRFHAGVYSNLGVKTRRENPAWKRHFFWRENANILDKKDPFIGV